MEKNTKILEDLKEFLHRKYESIEAFLQNVIFPVFGEDLFESAGNDNVLRRHPELQPKADACNIKKIISVGRILIEGSELEIYDITISSQRQLARSRVSIQEIIRQIIGTHSGAFMIFHYQTQEGHWDWRFTFCHKGASQIDSSDAKRYTFLLGPNQSCRTAAENFMKLHDKIERDGELEIDDIVEAFNVEVVSKEFFGKYKAHYEKFCKFVYDNKNDEQYFGSEFAKWEDKTIRDYVKKLLGRIVFLHFLQKKGWLGVPAGKQYGEGDHQFMKHLFETSSDEQKANYLDEVLEPLFSDMHKIINGGLFERDEMDAPKSTFPAEYFADLFEFFDQYNFTIDENDPDDAEVGIDPEMLGRIFENLLEDNKDKGAFYTPKEIVQYMCRESLIAYLTTCVMKKQGENHQPEEKIQDAVRKLLKDPESIVSKMTPEHLADFGSYIRKVKICDPAIGSGAFPMGLLNELVRCRTSIGAWATDKDGNVLEGDYAALKAEIICNNIYGVDIEKGAIDIARLRFWLSIIVDEQTPHALPNFDYKFMEGNSLIPTFGGQYINLNTKEQQHINVGKMIEVKKDILKLKNQFYGASGNEKLELNIKIKDHILQLISLQLGYEIKAWANAHAEELSLFPEGQEISVKEAINQLPADRLRVVELGKSLRSRLADESLPLSVRAQTDIKFFDWRLMFTEVFDVEDKNGGFDIVIGNPPYLFLSGKGSPVQKLRNEGCNDKAEELQLLFDKYADSFSEVSKGCRDFYKWFYKLAINLAKSGGIVSYITPDTFFNMPRYKDLRKQIFMHQALYMYDLGFSVFDAPTVSTGISLLRKGSTTNEVSYADIKMLLTKHNRYLLSTIIDNNRIQAPINDCEMAAFKHPLASKLYNSSINTSASSYLRFIEGEHNIHINVDRLYTSNNNNLVPVLVDSMMKRNGYIPKYYIEDICSVSDIHCGDCAVLRKTGDTIVCSVPETEDTAIAHQNVYVVRPLNDQYPMYMWMAILNSKLLTFLYQNGLFGQKGRTMAQFRVYALEALPIPIKLDNKLCVQIKNLTMKLLTTDCQKQTIEAEIDKLVYQLYGLTEEEITIVEEAT